MRPCFISKIETNIETGQLFARFPLWPLAVLYRTSESESGKVTLNKLIANALRNIPGSASRPAPQEAVELYLLAPGL
jgi:ABC-type phosphonate transport system ATPase subunit